MIIDQLPEVSAVQETDEIPVERGTTTYKSTLQKLKDLVASLLTKSDVGLGNVDNVRQYSAENSPPYPVTSVNDKTGAVRLAAADVGALPDTIPHVVENGASGVWSWTLYSDNTVDLYLTATVQIENYSSSTFGGLYLYGPVNFPFSLQTGYVLVAGCKIGNGLSIIALSNALSGTQISIVGQSNITGLQYCTFQAHIHGVKV